MRRLFAIVFVLGSLAGSGCKQGQGDRCQVNDDCGANLRCSTGKKAGYQVCEPDTLTVTADAPPSTPTVDASPAADAASSDGTPSIDAAVPAIDAPVSTPDAPTDAADAASGDA